LFDLSDTIAGQHFAPLIARFGDVVAEITKTMVAGKFGSTGRRVADLGGNWAAARRRNAQSPWVQACLSARSYRCGKAPVCPRRIRLRTTRGHAPCRSQKRP